MTKANPLRNVFNGGKFSIFVEGRVDIDRYPASMRKLHNFVAAAQGPALRRSGTEMITPAAYNGSRSVMIPFERSATDVLILEFGGGIIRFITEDGLQLNPDGTPYSIVSPFSDVEILRIRYEQSVDVLYLFCDGFRPKTLSRFGAYDWRLADIQFTGGPYLPEGTAIGRFTLDGGGVIVDGTASDNVGANIGHSDARFAFDGNLANSWFAGFHNGKQNKDGTYYYGDSQLAQVGYITNTPRVLQGYVLYPSVENISDSFAALDFAPKTWTLEASNDATAVDNGTWTVLDRQQGYILWDDNRSIIFKIKNSTPYKSYKLNIIECRSNATQVYAALAQISLNFPTDPIASTRVHYAGDLSNINHGIGFVPTDVGRLLRLYGTDNRWRNLKITAVIDGLQVQATVLDEPFLNPGEPILRYQLGAWSDTTGWPTTGKFMDDRLWCAGSIDTPDIISASVVSAYTDMSAQTAAEEVLDTSAIFIRLNSRKVAAVQWMCPDDKGMMVGTGTSEWIIGASDKSSDSTITARNIKATPQTERGSANVVAIKIDKQALYVQATGRTVREYAYAYEVDGFKSQSMSVFASDLGTPGFVKLAYASEPHSVVWALRGDGTVVGLTYDRDQKVVGWHTHDFGCIVEDIAVLPSPEDKQDCLWISAYRVFNNVEYRFIEKMKPFWDFDSNLGDAFFVDCGRTYVGASTQTVLAPWLANQKVTGLAGGIPFHNVMAAADGTIITPYASSTITVGLPFVSEAETTPIEAGATVGTSQGKSKRIDQLKIYLWESAFGEIGTYNEDMEAPEYQPVDYRVPADFMEDPTLYSQIVPATMPGGYGYFGTLLFRQMEPLPFNVISLMPDMVTNDG